MAKPKTDAKPKTEPKPKAAKKAPAKKGKAAEPRPPTPWAIDAHLEPIEAALLRVAKRLAKMGERTQLGAKASREQIEAAEAATGGPLPDDVRALLTLHDGLALAEHVFLSTRDHKDDTDLAKTARSSLASRKEHAGCVAIASWGPAGDWLVFDPTGSLRAGTPGLALIGSRAGTVDGIVGALKAIEDAH